MLKFIKLIVTHAEAKIEQTKILERLLQFNFDPYLLYKRICQKQKYITNYLIITLLKNHQIIITNDDANLILKHFNRSESNIITFSDFYETIFQSAVVKLDDNSNDDDSEIQIVRYFISVIAWQKVIEERQKEIEDSYLILNLLFKSHRTICIRRLHRFLNSITSIPKEITLIVFKAIDLQKQQKITKFEFYKEIFKHDKPFEFGKHWKFQSIGCSAEFKSTIHSENDQ